LRVTAGVLSEPLGTGNTGPGQESKKAAQAPH
jgi:hypothetical protein